MRSVKFRAQEAAERNPRPTDGGRGARATRRGASADPMGQRGDSPCVFSGASYEVSRYSLRRITASWWRLIARS